MAYKDENWNIISSKQKVIQTLKKGRKNFNFKWKIFYWFEGLSMFEWEALTEPLNWFVEINWYNRNLKLWQPPFTWKVDITKIKEI